MVIINVQDVYDVSGCAVITVGYWCNFCNFHYMHLQFKVGCVCETLIPLKQLFFEKFDPDI